jgi:Ca2+-binding RTX toxin-like protein
MKQRGYWAGLSIITLSLVLAGVATPDSTRWTRTLTGLVLTAALSGGFLTRASVVRPAVPGCGAFEEPTIVGTANADELGGTSGDDVIVGLGGKDIIAGGSGRDVICGGKGADAIQGGRSGDVLFGDAGGDEIEGGLRFDTIHGGTEHDMMLGGRVGDAFAGGPGNDIFNGCAGNDVAQFFDSSAAVNANLAKGTANGEGSDTLTGIERLDGCKFDDILIGDDGPIFLIGEGGNNTFHWGWQRSPPGG